ncbi:MULTISPECIES: diadenylate cyclase CdaA [Anaerosinus]|uniref:Diadenylate cyclase n=1 Tax=Selenobaculum gibii TaxID=3054208 RepID=A0A9Y2EUY7_9FIRM|nr:diadenylate cyclase CdaA [Selenobaculum gbiensis]WIW70024.1 diadenylate cyclase CdaA [Selenobaculum gbiensis]
MPIQLKGLISTISFLDIVDILIVAFILYKLYMLLKDTRAITLVKGLLVLLVLTMVSNWLGLNVIYWLMQKTVTLVFVALPLVFQPELRRTLEHLGQGKLFGKSVFLNIEEAKSLVNELDKAVMVLAQNKIGALIVLERENILSDYIATGIQIDGLVSSEFLINVFIPNTPLHDGAAIIRGNRMISAGCLLPLTDDRTLSKELGTRHRAAIGITEQSDAIVLVVSEETGTISIARGGRLTRHLDSEKLKQNLKPLFTTRPTSIMDWFNWRHSK